MRLVDLIGYTSLVSIPKVLNPEIKIPIILVSTVVPGAGPKDVETLVTQQIEDGVNGVTNVKTITSSSQNSVSVVQIEFNSERYHTKTTRSPRKGTRSQ